MTKLLQPLLAASVLVIIGLLAVWSHEPILVPSLGSVLFTQIYDAREPAAGPYSVGVGQVAGLVGGFVGVFVAFAGSTPSFMSDHPLVYARVLAVAIALPLAAGLQTLFRALSPAGGATALIVALGAETADWAGGIRMLVGIGVVTCLGEIARRFVLRSQGKVRAT